MRRLSVDSMIKLIKGQKTFEAIAEDGAFEIRIEKYVPVVGVAIHDGHQFRPELETKCALSALERVYEEDPHTGEMIRSLPITLVAKDSRYEYDLNRSPELAIYDQAWGKTVWKSELTARQRKTSLKKHEMFYKVVHALLAELSRLFGGALVFDIHSYNWKRHEDLRCGHLNVGTSRIQNETFHKVIGNWKGGLSKIELDGDNVVVTENELFLGKGYFLQFCQEQFSNVLVLATEVRKFFCEEETGTPFPMVIQTLSEELKKAMTVTSLYFMSEVLKMKGRSKFAILSFEIDKNLESADRQLYKLTRKFEILSQINPINLESEKRRFFKNREQQEPDFKYKPLPIDPFQFKRELYQLPIDKIQDVDVYNMYGAIVDSFADKIDMLSVIGESKFRYASLRYFGGPDDEEVAKAKFILGCINTVNSEGLRNIPADEAVERFRQAKARFGFEFKVEITPNIVSRALVVNNRQALRVKKGVMFSENEVKALIAHEIGVHMVTTLNALEQPLFFPRIGMPINTRTQEGLAILAEYFSGCLTVERLQELSLRVIAVDLMLQGNTFCETFHELVHEYKLEKEKAFYLTTRVHRAGGFTKDYLYLQGFRQILNHERKTNSLAPLLIGKMSLEYEPILTELIQREWLKPPKYTNSSFFKPRMHDPVMNYLISCLNDGDLEWNLAS